jgi:hypothetical protein
MGPFGGYQLAVTPQKGTSDRDPVYGRHWRVASWRNPLKGTNWGDGKEGTPLGIPFGEKTLS